MSAPWTVTEDGPLVVVTLAHGKLNLFDEAVFTGLEEIVDRLTADPPRGLLLRAEGRVVSGGVDVGEVFDGMDTEGGAQLWQRLLRTTQAIEDLPCPTVFAAHGLTLTAAFEIALACDLIVAARDARFGLVEIVVGLTPSMGGTQRLSERAGPGRARELVYTGELYDAETMERWNVINRVFEQDDFETSARDFALRLANGPTRAHAATKAVVRAQCDAGGVRGADARVPELSGELFATDDLRNAVRSFLTEGPGRATYEGH